MIVDHRTYELQPGRLPDFLALYEKEGLPVQKKHLGNLVGFFTTEVGNVNEIVHIWATKISPIAPSVAPRWRRTRHGRLTCRRAENS
jgi:hypothetical protein